MDAIHYNVKILNCTVAFILEDGLLNLKVLSTCTHSKLLTQTKKGLSWTIRVTVPNIGEWTIRSIYNPEFFLQLEQL